LLSPLTQPCLGRHVTADRHYGAKIDDQASEGQHRPMLDTGETPLAAPGLVRGTTSHPQDCAPGGINLR